MLAPAAIKPPAPWD